VTTIVPQIYFLSISMIFHNNHIHHPLTNCTLPRPACTFPLHKKSFASMVERSNPLHRTTFLKP